MPAPADPLVLITGSSGLLGQSIAGRLAPDHTVVGLDVKRPSGDAAVDDFFECDLTDGEGTRSTLAQVRERHGSRVASVIHLAAYYDFSGEPSPLYEELTVEGTRRLLRTLREEMETVEQLVFSSTLLVMKPVDKGEVLTEDDPLQAEWDYPRSKVEAERVLRDESGPVPVVILRIAGVYDEDGHSPPITQHMARIREKRLESVFFPGDRDRGQPFVHRDDVAECFRKVVEARKRLDEHEVFLIAEPEVVTYADFQESLGELIHGREWPTLRVPAPVAKAGAWVKEKLPGGEEEFIKPWMVDLADAHYPVSIQRARERLGWDPAKRLRDTLPEMVARMQRDPLAWYRENDLPLPGALEEEAQRRERAERESAERAGAKGAPRR